MEKGKAHAFGSLIRDIDLFGQPVTLKYKERSHSKTIIGGLTTILYVAGLAVYFAMLVSQSTLKSNYSTRSLD